jgi:hypothetical protein
MGQPSCSIDDHLGKFINNQYLIFDCKGLYSPAGSKLTRRTDESFKAATVDKHRSVSDSSHAVPFSAIVPPLSTSVLAFPVTSFYYVSVPRGGFNTFLPRVSVERGGF